MKNLFLISRSLFLGLFLIVFTQSCTDLDEELFDEVLEENFYQSDDEFIAALGQSYTTLYGYMGDYFGLQEVSSDAMVVPTRGADWDDGGHWRRLHQHQYNPLDPLIGGGWTFAFGGINTCNRLIFQFE
ncbi:MAG: RagB/SusD family nutrient uptake outer membrane protein, partial [Bacteroidota bacterium]